jgi:uncharacterized membrane protein YjjP (DUF1212 family)
LTQTHTSAEPTILGPLLLDTGILLLRSGASSNRIQIIIHRIASAYHNLTHVDIGPKSISLTLQPITGTALFNGTRNTPDYGVNFKLLSGIDMMSQNLATNQWTLSELKNELDKLKELPHYPRMLVLPAVALAGASFCYTFGGDVWEMGITFGATFCGLFVKQALIKKALNTYICTFLSALVAASFTGLFFNAGSDLQPEHAYATCILFLIPGVPLINFFLDLIAGNILYGLERGINALIHILSIALALSAAVFMFHFQL